MSTKQEPSEARIERLLLEARRHDLIYWLLWIVPGVVVSASIPSGLVFGPQPLWVRILDWASWIILLIWLAAGILLGIGPKFIREFAFGPEPELSENQKGNKARRDEIRNN
jgi:hypothetical protein